MTDEGEFYPARWEDEEDWPDEDYDSFNGDPSPEYIGYAGRWHGKGSTSKKQPFDKKNAPEFDGNKPWFTYEKQVREWKIITERTNPKAMGTLLKIRITGRAQAFIKNLDDDKIVQEDGVDYLMKELKKHYIKDAESMFYNRFFRLLKCNRGSEDFHMWTQRFQYALKQALETWQSLQVDQEREGLNYQNWITEQNLSEETTAACAYFRRQRTLREEWLAIDASRRPTQPQLPAWPDITVTTDTDEVFERFQREEKTI